MEKNKKKLEYKNYCLNKIFDKYIISSKTDLKGIITETSSAFEKISGYTKDELIGEPHNIVRHPDMKKEVFKELWKTIQQDYKWSGEVKNKRKDGTFYWTSTIIEPDYDVYGMKIGYISLREDITAKKELEELKLELEKKVEDRTKELENLTQNLKLKVEEQLKELRDKDTSLLEQSKMASMGEMIGNIAHQWRQPLSAINATASGVKLSNELDLNTKEDIRDNLDLIINKAEYLSETINIFRDFLTPNNSSKEVLILEDNINIGLDIIKAAINSSYINLINKIDYNKQTKIFGVKNELPQVIINIINNAKDILIEKDIKDKYIILDLNINNDMAIITIEDNAKGVPLDVIGKIFEPYFTTKHQSQGTGLGLNMSYKIVTDSFKGKLYVKNTENGAKFYIEIPIYLD